MAEHPADSMRWGDEKRVGESAEETPLPPRSGADCPNCGVNLLYHRADDTYEKGGMYYWHCPKCGVLLKDGMNIPLSVAEEAPCG